MHVYKLPPTLNSIIFSSPAAIMTTLAGDISGNPNPHIVLVPLQAQGHMIPMLDMARLLAARGATITFVTTPVNAVRIQPQIDKLTPTTSIRFLILPLPCAEAGLPENTENFDLLPSRSLSVNLFAASALLLSPLTHHLTSTSPPPSCIIADACHPWTRNIAAHFSIPRFVFHGFCCFALLSIYNTRVLGMLDADHSEADTPFDIPGIPDRVRFTRRMLPGFYREATLDQFRHDMVAGEEAADGVVVNSFDKLEPEYSDYYARARGKRVWTIGPMWDRTADVAVRGDRAGIDPNRCIRWLDSKEPGSVIYVSFGSLARTAPSQVIEIARGLEAAGHPFVWALKAGEKSAAVEAWLAADGFEERVKEKGMLIRGWAPQVMILSHSAVGGFMTHCGWNSTLEAAVAGVPMVTWPHFADQFLNERLVVDVLGIGVSVGVKGVTSWGEEHTEAAVGRDDVERAVRAVMSDEVMARKAKEIETAAKEAVKEGGSSHTNLSDLMKFISSRDRDLPKDEKKA